MILLSSCAQSICFLTLRRRLSWSPSTLLLQANGRSSGVGHGRVNPIGRGSSVFFFEPHSSLASMGALVCYGSLGLASHPCHLKDACRHMAAKLPVHRFQKISLRTGLSGCRASSSSKPPQETVLEALSEAAKSEGRIAQTTNIVLGGTVSGTSDEEWKELNEKVNSYPTTVNFTAIGSGGDDFVQAMVGAVESVLQCPIPEDEVKLSMSSKGKYVSVRIGPVAVDSSDQVQAVYQAMKRDKRMKYFL